MLLPQKVCFGKPSTQRECFKCHWLYLFGMMAMGSPFLENIRQPKTLFLRHWQACSMIVPKVGCIYIPQRDGITPDLCKLFRSEERRVGKECNLSWTRREREK